MKFPPYILNRLRRDPPLGCIVTGSTPVIAFGDLFSARVATLGLNPSNREFVDLDGRLLSGEKRRLATLESLRLERLSSATDQDAARIAEECATYFQRNPYRGWFDQLEPILKLFGASYYDGSACHLDLVQWATMPKWGRLTSEERRQLLVGDTPFLVEQLQHEGIRHLLLNGASVVTQFSNLLGVKLTELACIVEGGRYPTRIYRGELLRRVRVIGWTSNIQSPFGLTLRRRQLICEHLSFMTT